MDVAELIKVRLEQLNYEQSDLAAAVQVTQSFISQLLNRKKKPPSPHRTDIYHKMEDFLKLPSGDLGRLVDLQRKQELKTKIEAAPSPLFEEVRKVILGKCNPVKEKQIRQIFAKEPFGDIERIVTQNCTFFLEPLVASWDIDLITFHMSVVLRPQLGKEQLKRFAFVELEPDPPADEKNGLRGFLSEHQASLDITHEEVEFLKALRVKGRRPNTLYYYRELQNLRDPLHFLEVRIEKRKDDS